MILSMTGFGKAVAHIGNNKVTAEIKSLNSKQMDISLKMPHQFSEIELELRNTIAQKLKRGKVELYITCEIDDTATTDSPVRFNLSLLKSYKEQLELMSQQLQIPQPDDWYATLLKLPDAYKTDSDADRLDEETARQIKEVVNSAIEKLIGFRIQEGERLEQFFEDKINAIQLLLDEVPKHETERVPKIKARITEALEKCEATGYDSNRLEQELIFYIEKLDITEEKIRLQNHLNYFLDTLHKEEAQGKKLGFISQEMGREINTLGSKANEAELQKVVVRMKDNLEQIKEQVLNVL